ncbi:VHS1047 protein [Vibrio phage 1]|nr:VHS1047 protein [Vibrio phage 1]
MARRRSLEEQSNAELIRHHKARARFRDPSLRLCEANRDIARQNDGAKAYKCVMCNTFKPLDDFSEFQQIKPFGRTCIACQSRPTRYNLED